MHTYLTFKNVNSMRVITMQWVHRMTGECQQKCQAIDEEERSKFEK